MEMQVPTLSDPLAGVKPVTLDEQWEAARTMVRTVLRVHGIPVEGPFDDLPAEVLRDLDIGLEAAGLTFTSVWPREKKPKKPHKKRVK